ncbi:hemicentin-2 [Papilio machaon]|uniref:hemicentin-2 n=1 Tax=Papilio machaon TaxID=76193 RepID=UPI001E663425|nr:hemicentin-2 [Papilio machaon]
MEFYRLLSPFTLLLFCAVCSALPEDEQHDAHEGDDVTLQCRFSLPPGPDSLTYYWVRNTASGHDNVAIGNIPLETNYQIKYAPSEGRFDLLVSNVTYERDNGRFECRVKAGGSGRTLHAQGHALTVLTPPQPPRLTPGPRALAHEEQELRLQCSSSGGSPEPSIKWYREGSPSVLEASLEHGRTRAEPSVATLVLTPRREDDGAVFRCVVWNRAMAAGGQYNATVQLSVNYFPRVEIGPENPLRIEVDGTATMDCKVDAKPKVTSVRWTRNGKYISNSFTHTIQGVVVQDAGQYTCSADNGLGRPGENEITLDVLFPPTVTIDSKTYEAEEGGNVEIHCEVSANPEPTSIEWTMEGKPEFRQKGKTLTLTRVDADVAGTYTCRAVNIISTSNGNRAERASSASVAVLVRHKPGRAHITPERPVAQEGAGVTLTCSARPPGWPAPQYRWFRDIDTSDANPIVLATGVTYNIPNAHLGSEGVYHCQATNELGHGELASVTLEVHQPPRFQSKLQPHTTKRSREQNFSLSCSAFGKPLPNVKWYKNNSEIKPDVNLYEVKTDVTEGRDSVYNVQSTLRFYGKARPNGNDLIPEDRGSYTCAVENEVKKIESSMHLRIEHEPISIRQQKKVAFDVMEPAEISCRVQAYPKPDFLWFYGSSNSPLSSSDHYDITTVTEDNDSYLSTLKLRNVKPQDYGDYYCTVKNSLGSIRPQIRLQPKGAPESPRGLTSQKIGSTFVTLKWESGFDGGLSNIYYVWYRRVARGAGSVEQCAGNRNDVNEWKEYDCMRANPCNVTRLDQHNTYSFKVKAVNTKGQSNYSNEITVTTKVNKILPPEQLTYDPSTRAVVFSVGPTCLGLVAVAEGLGRSGGWQVVETIPLSVSGVSSSVQRGTLAGAGPPGLGLGPAASAPAMDDLNPRLRLRLCLLHKQDVCSEYVEADIGPAYIKEASALTTATLIAIVVSVIVFVLFLCLLFIFCRCKRTEKKKKDYEMASIGHGMSLTSPKNQAPPPYMEYPNAGMENKALEHSMDLTMDDSKNAVYATQAAYGYHIAPHTTPTHVGQNMSNLDWVNTGYMDKGYANSNNGGSVNSQDSLWQMKMAAANNPGMMMLERTSNYGYDPMHAGYGTIDDYAAYQPLPHPPHGGHAPHTGHAQLAGHAPLTGHAPAGTDYMRTSQNPSRQDYCSDSYASVHKPKKRMDQHTESPYHEVSGLPETYAGGVGGAEGEEGGAEEKPPPLSLSYDESLESGYSTPNSRARRVIREIIV